MYKFHMLASWALDLTHHLKPAAHDFLKVPCDHVAQQTIHNILPTSGC